MDAVTVSPLIQIGGAALWVRDLDAVERFYREVVGLELIDRSDRMSRLGVDGHAFLDLLHRPDALPRDPEAAGLYHIAFLLPSRADLGRWLAHAATLGLRLDGAADHLVSEAVYLHDPEGNGVEIYRDRDPSEWTWADESEGRRIVMANDRLDMIGLRGATSGPWRGAPSGTRIGHVHLQVGDVDQAVAFYTGVVGLDVTRHWPKAAFMSTSGYHHHLAANTWASAGAGQRDPSRAGLASVTLDAAPKTIAAIAQRAGTANSPAAAGLRDPWGTQINFVTESAP